MLLGLMSCSPDKDFLPPEAGYEYFPLEFGQSRTYIVDSILLDPVAGGVRRDTIRTFLREVVTDTFRHPEGMLLFSVEQSVRRSDTLDWQLSGVVFRSVDAYRAESWQGSLRFIELSFPLAPGKQWDGLAYVSPFSPVFVAGEPLYPFTFSPFEVVELNKPLEVGFTRYERTCRVEAISSNLIEYRRWTAVYAFGIGLIVREFEVLDTQVLDASLGWEEKAEKGLIYRQYLVEP